MKKRNIKQKLKKFGRTTVLVLLLVSLNINPIAMASTLILESGIVGKFSNLGRNLVYLAGKQLDEVYAATEVSITNTPASYFSNTQSYLYRMMQYLESVGDDSDGNSLYSTIRELYYMGSGYSHNVKIDADHPENRDYGSSLAVHDEAMTARLLGVNERDLSHVNAAQIEQLMQMGYDPRWVNENGTIEEDLDKLIRATHEYSVANVYSLNNMIGGALWKPYSDEIPYIREFAEIVGGFANVYMGYWDTNVSTLKQPINSQRALEILGYDAILRYEGIQVLEPTKTLENGVEAIFVPEVVGLEKYTESPVNRTIIDDPDMHYDEIPDRNLGLSGVGGVPTGQSGINENVILRQVEVGADGTAKYIAEDDIESAIIPDSTIVQLYQEEIPNEDITWLDAVTVLYKALGKEQISYQTFTAYNPNLTPETSPLSRELPGLTSFDGYNFYAFFTRSNPYSGDLSTGSFQAIYWRKAVNDGFVSYALRDEPISAEDFYMLAKRMMESYGEPEMSADEMHTLLQIYGSYYPVQLGRTVADAWEYLKCRGILTDDNAPESFTSTITRDQLLDICMRIKDKDSRITYKNMNLTIDVGEILRDKDYFPVYDFDLKTEEDDEYAFISTTVNYDSYDYYTYMFPVERAVTLGNSGCGLVYNKPEKSDENLIDLALYEGKKHIEGYDYYVIDVPKEYTGGIFLGFQNYDDPGSVNGTVDFIEVPNYCLGGGIYTAYEITEKSGMTIATLVKPEEGVSYFPFSSQSNNMELVYYCDIDRCDKERPIGYESASISGMWEKIVDKWNYLTQPMEVLADEIDDAEQEHDSDANLITKVAANGDYWRSANSTYGDGDNQIKLVEDGDTTTTQVAPNAPGWFSVLARASVLCSSSLGVWDITKPGSADLSESGRAALSHLNAQVAGGNPGHPNVSIGYNLVDANRGANNTPPRRTELYNRMVDIQKSGSHLMDGRKRLIAFAAGINPKQISGVAGSGTASGSDLDGDVNKVLQYMASRKSAWSNSIAKFNGVSNWDNNNSTYSKAIRVTYSESGSGGVFEIKSRGYSSSAIIDMLGDAGQKGTESGVASSSADIADIKTSLNTSAIMGKDKQILLCWDDLVDTGYAWGLVDGKPKHSEKDSTYTFMTKNGMVKVNDIYHMIQIGTTLYTWPDDTAPNLVYVDDDRNMYLDIRCVTGIIDIPITELGPKSVVLNNYIGTGKYAVYSISTSGAYTSLYSTKGISCYNFPETTVTGGSGTAAGVTFPVTMNTLDLTAFDGEDVGTGDKYWEDADGMRVLLADFNPTSNWILTITDDEGMYYGKLYVYYLKDAFKTDSFSDGGKPPTPAKGWQQYWEDEIEKQKQRCDANYDSVSRDVAKAMESYRAEVGDGFDWLANMTEVAMYSIAADTGTFYLSDDYAVRCFDVTENSIPTQPMNTDFTVEVDAVNGNDFRSNDPGSVYFMDYAGYVYNLPKYNDWTLKDYLSGKYPLPLVNKDDREIWNMNMTWYGMTKDSIVIPYGCELTSDGFINYKDLKVVIPSSELPNRARTKKVLDSHGGLESVDDIENEGYKLENTSLPFYLTPSGSESYVSGEVSTFKPAPTAIYARYGILDSGINATRVGVISQNETKRNYYYLGNRTVCISDDFTSKDANKIPFDFASSSYNPIAITSSSEAHFVGQVRRPISRSYYVLPYAKIYEVTSAITENSNEEHLATDDSYLWDGKVKLVAVLNMIDRGTNWFMWAVFRLAPMICVIVMTILIGLSFITDNKVWLNFCEKFFDPVRLLTIGMKDSNSWHWKDVWRRATITYIAFALFANANILKIVIWAVDGWMRITEALGF